MKASEIDRLKQDLLATVKELSDSYEELSLLYRLSEEFLGLNVDEICRVFLKEIKYLLNVKTAVILFLDEEKNCLYTKECSGAWDAEVTISSKDNLFWYVLETGKPMAICKLNSTKWKMEGFDFDSILVVPLRGKKRVLGSVVVADKEEGREFFAGDIKLLNTISFFTSLFIENALLSKEIQTFLIGTIKSFVKALEATSLWTAGHTERVTEYAIGIGREMGLSSSELERLRICSLLHDIGKITIPREILNKRDELDDHEWDELMRHPVVGAEILSELSGFTEVIDCIKYHHEHYDGSGLHGMKGEDIPMMSRILAVADAFDAMTSDRPYRHRKTFQQAIEEIRNNAGKQFDPVVVDAFLRWIGAKLSVLDL